MPELPVFSGREALRAFERDGWMLRRQSGSHMVLTKPGNMASLSIPDHKELAVGTLRKLIRSSGMSVEEFIRRLKA